METLTSRHVKFRRCLDGRCSLQVAVLVVVLGTYLFAVREVERLRG
jgi:hypothetical protein